MAVSLQSPMFRKLRSALLRRQQRFASGEARPVVVTAPHPLSNTSHDSRSANLDEPVDVTFGDVAMAAHRIKHAVHPTAVYKSGKMSKLLGSNIYFKDEFQLVGTDVFIVSRFPAIHFHRECWLLERRLSAVAHSRPHAQYLTRHRSRQAHSKSAARGTL